MRLPGVGAGGVVDNVKLIGQGRAVRLQAASEVPGVRRYHRNSGRAAAAARGGVLWVALCKGWS